MRWRGILLISAVHGASGALPLPTGVSDPEGCEREPFRSLFQIVTQSSLDGLIDNMRQVIETRRTRMKSKLFKIPRKYEDK